MVFSLYYWQRTVNYMKLFSIIRSVCLGIGLLGSTSLAWAGPFAPKAGAEGSTAVAKDDPGLVAWASDVFQYTAGANVSTTWQDTSKALGAATGSSIDITCLGDGGSITLSFAFALYDGPGADFAVFENGFSDTFLELAFVEVSSNGVDFVRFAATSETTSPVGGFGSLDPTNLDGLAGKYRVGFGTPFDLADLADQAGYASLNLASIQYLRIVDIIGDGRSLDQFGQPIYDPYPGSGSAGFDLEAVGAFYVVPEPATAALLAGCISLLTLVRRRRR